MPSGPPASSRRAASARDRASATIRLTSGAGPAAAAAAAAGRPPLNPLLAPAAAWAGAWACCCCCCCNCCARSLAISAFLASSSFLGMPPGLSCASSSSSHNSRQKMADSFSPRKAARSTCASLGSTVAGGAPSSGTGGKNKFTAMLWTISSSSPPNRAVMRSSIHCVRMSRWARVVSTRREKLAGNLVERTNFVRARSSAMEPVPLMVGIAAVLLGVGGSLWGLCRAYLLFNT